MLCKSNNAINSNELCEKMLADNAGDSYPYADPDVA